MNVRIRELAEQAGWDMGDEIEGFNTRLEKFAELIVRDCVGLLMKPAVMEWSEKELSALSAYNSGWVNGRLLGVEHIKRHFGVKP